MSCSKNLYSQRDEEKAWGLSLKVASIIRRNRNETVRNIWNEVVKYLSNLESFEFARDASGVKYEKSMSELYQDLDNKFKEVVTKYKGQEGYNEISALARSEFDAAAGISKDHSVVVTDPEGYVMENNPDTPSDLLVNSMTLKDLTKKFYGSVIKAAEYRLNEFGTSLLESAIIDRTNRVIVRNNRDLNKAICGLKNSYFNNVLDYIKTKDPSFNYDGAMFNDKGEVIPGYAQVLNKFYSLLVARSESENIETTITEGWKKKIYGESGDENTFYNALNSYVNLIYFDESLKEAVGDVIQLSDAAYKGIELDGRFRKYVFSKGDEHKRKGFQNSENRDALKDIAKFSKLIIGNVPLYSVEDNKPLNRNMNLGIFCNAFTSLFTHAHLLGSNYTTLQNAIVNYHSNPHYYSKIIFSELANPNNVDLKMNLNSIGVNPFNINVLVSAYKYFFDPKNPQSIINIETKDMKSGFVIDGYSIIDCLNGIIDRTMDATYMQLEYSSALGMTTVTPKKKYAVRKGSYNISNKINTNNFRRSLEERERLLSRFPVRKMNLIETALKGSEQGIIDASCRTFTIGINDNLFLVATSSETMGVLSTKPLTIKFADKLGVEYKNMKDILGSETSKIDLTSSTTIQNLIDNLNLTDSEQKFRDLLQFIDEFLDTKFLSEDGMTKLLYFKMLLSGNNFLVSLFDSAVKTAVVNLLYYQFELAKSKGEYDNLGFEAFLKNNYLPFALIDFSKYEQTRSYFVKRLGNPQPISVPTSATWIDLLANVEAIMTGAISLSTTKDIHGNKIANNRTSFLGGNLLYYLSKYRQAGDNTATSPLLFTKNNGLITKTVFDTDAKSRIGIKKSTKDMKASELFYSSIIHKFFGNYILKDIDAEKFGRNSELANTIITLPTTFSDKTSFVSYAIKANKPIKLEGEKYRNRSYLNKAIWDLSSSELVDLYLDTIGDAYVNLYNNVLNDLRQVLELQANATFEEIDAKLHSTKWEDLLDAAQKKGIELLLDTHYRKDGDYCKFNELLYHYANDLYVNREALEQRFQNEKVNFINNLLASGVQFYTTYYNESDDVFRMSTDSKRKESSNPVSQIINQLTGKDKPLGNKSDYLKKWVKHHKLIFAKIDGKDVYSGAEIEYTPGMLIELNPLLEKYFFTDSLIANNLRFELTGSEIAHPDKSKINISKEFTDPRVGITPLTHPTYFEYDSAGNVIMDKGVPKALNRFNDLIWLKKLADLDPILKNLYNRLILKVEAVAQGTLLKRNVIIPATLQYEQQMVLNGIPKRMKVAVIEDTPADVFNFRGDTDKIDAHDGAAYINPFVSRLENKALQDLEVGVDKKPIWHSYNPRLMSATLLKFATFTMTNERMRTSLNSNISLYKIFKLMTNLLWQDLETGKWNNDRGLEFNLVDTIGYKANGSSRLRFSTIVSEKPYYYEENGHYYRITDFGMDEHGYYTKELEVSLTGVDISERELKIYHYYDKDSNHLKFQDPSLKPADYHNINSLFELFNAFGGIYSGEMVEDDNGRLEFKYNDASSEVVVNFMNNISIRVGNDTNDMSLRTYYQPLKDMMIAYAANASAVKNGTANLNSKQAWKGDTKLRYMTLDTDGLGVQMDADHNIDESEMTEFSQVISALEAGGRLHRQSKLVYRTLGTLATLASQDEIETATKYIRAKLELKAREEAKAAGKPITDDRVIPLNRIKSELYDIVGRTLINNYKGREGKVDLAKPIILEVKRIFNLNDDHHLDEILIPFSDSNLYSLVISLFVSNINSKSIKRKYPGSGCVMVPGYGIILTYKYAGKIKVFDDVLKEAREANFHLKFYADFDSSKWNINDYNKYLVNAYLGTLQLKEWENATIDVDRFIPTDIVDVLADGKYLGTIDLSKPDVYYNFKGFTENDLDGVNAEATRRGFISKYLGRDISSVKDLTYSMNITNPRDLAPARIIWEYEAKKELNDAILSRSSDNEFNSDVAVILKPSKLNIWFLGTNEDLAQFRNWLSTSQGKQVANNDPILAQVSLVVNRNPLIVAALQAMGATVEQYAAYVEDIFPNSKEKDIYWHGSNSDFSLGFDSALRGVGSGAPETGGEFYLAKQPYSVLQYVNGLNRTASPDKNGFAHWNKLYWALKEIMSNGRRENNDWKDLIIGNDPNNVRKEIPNKRGEFNRSGKGEQHGKFLDEYKDEYGYKDRTDEEFFRDIFGINYGTETFNNWIARNKAIFLSMEADPNVKGIYPAVINVNNPIIERGKNTYYLEQRGLFGLAASTTRTRTINIFDTKPVRESFLRLKDQTFDKKANRKEIQSLLDELSNGRYNGLGIKNLLNEAAELVISNMYASKFSTKGKALSDIVENPNFFKVKKINAIKSKHYDMVFTTNSGKHTYVTFVAPRADSENAFAPKYRSWEYTVTKGNDVYATNKEGQRLFKIGYNVRRPDLHKIGDDYFDSNENRIVNSNLRMSNGEVVEYREYISRYTVVENQLGKDGQNRLLNYDVYYINYDTIGKTLKNPSLDAINGLVGKILSDLFNSNRYNGIRINPYYLYTSSAKKIANIIPYMTKYIKGKVGNLLQNTLDNFLLDVNTTKSTYYLIDDKTYNKRLLEYYKDLKDELYASFLKSLTFTASRIPALTLLSFMLMKAVALTLSSKNIAYVSHWQTWLQGSDY